MWGYRERSAFKGYPHFLFRYQFLKFLTSSSGLRLYLLYVQCIWFLFEYFMFSKKKDTFAVNLYYFTVLCFLISKVSFRKHNVKFIKSIITSSRFQQKGRQDLLWHIVRNKTIRQFLIILRVTTQVSSVTWSSRNYSCRSIATDEKAHAILVFNNVMLHDLILYLCYVIKLAILAAIVVHAA